MEIHKRWINFLVDNLFLKNGTCPVCGKVLFVSPNFLCKECEDDLPYINEVTCMTCGKPIINIENKQCKLCRTEKFPFEGGYIWLYYREGGRRIISKIKFHDCTNLGIWAGKEMGKNLITKEWSSDIDLIIPIPLHPKRYEERGYNQSEKIALGIYEILRDESSKKGLKEPSLRTDILKRVRNTPHQMGKERKERLINLKEAFEISKEKELFKKNILLVDDVLTTGSTLGEAGETLMNSGAGRVFVTTLCGGAG